ncbi:hypothetical protein C7C46_24945 [Streptomyces tateyamensis]|uniref:Uncharacterized protein n=1 Tax=Streptomyces tateyamensis TaxID=565073 RepID=A0A2V4MWU4_9ACTN|nr:hypothetical protein [Streptomyces tateyamensis]PYC73885.1 hypothetical protein C7C46_24945 [Streptomyces tateyamensis]
MRRTVLTVMLAAATLTGVAAAPAQAATGQVVVYSTQLEPLTVYQDPQGCTQLPPFAHVLNNQTDATVTVYADRWCTLPFTENALTLGQLAPGYGTHVTGAGSFRAP